MTTSKLSVHPVADVFPNMTQDEYDALKNDIATNGLRQPINVCNEQIIDGRHRYRACIDLGITPQIIELETDDEDDLLALVLSLNLHRRQLAASQRAMLAVYIERDESKSAKHRMQLGGKGKPILADLAGTAAAKAAKAVGVSAGYVKDAKRLKQRAPDLADKVLADPSFGLPAANRELAKRERVERDQTAASKDAKLQRQQNTERSARTETPEPVRPVAPAIPQSKELERVRRELDKQRQRNGDLYVTLNMLYRANISGSGLHEALEHTHALLSKDDKSCPAPAMQQAGHSAGGAL